LVFNRDKARWTKDWQGVGSCASIVEATLGNF
jgi:hypothetical protein